MRRRAIACANASQDAGKDLGFGEGARNPEQQLAEFFRRHYEVKYGGCCTWNGRRYALKAGMAPISPPGSSNHDDNIYEGYALAIDFNGWEDHWFDANCERFGIKNFGGKIGPGVNGEEWHGQPIELPNSRSDVNFYFAYGGKLKTWPLPGNPIPPQTYPGAQDMFHPITPFRNSDSRKYAPLVANKDYEWGLNPAIFPQDAVAVSMNVTAEVLDSEGVPVGAFLTIWASGPAPEASVLNFSGTRFANGYYSGPVLGRKIKLRANAPMHVILDVTGYWTP
jgi:hypothetical protein